MARTLQLGKVKSALSRAQRLGRIEERLTIIDLPFVISNLTPDEHTESYDACSEYEEAKFMHEYQQECLARAIVELDGVDLRDVAFVEEEVEDDKGNTVVRKVPRVEWLRRQVVSTWGKEALAVAYRKFAELMVRADEVASAGVVFANNDATDEDKARRLLGEAREVLEEIPLDLAAKILEDHGFQRVSSADEKAAIEKRAREWAAEESRKVAQKLAESVSEPEATEPPPAPEPPPAKPLAEVMAHRVPVHGVVPSSVPRDIVEAPLTGRAAEVARLEGFDPAAGVELTQPFVPSEPVELSAVAIREGAVPVNQPPAFGINPRFRPRP